jgi:hypothetical protein
MEEELTIQDLEFLESIAEELDYEVEDEIILGDVWYRTCESSCPCRDF